MWGHRIDYLFTRGSVIDADGDTDYGIYEDASVFLECQSLYQQGRGDEAEGECATGYYSDHRFQWALVGMPSR